MTNPRYEEFANSDELVELLERLYRRPRRSEPEPQTPPLIACVQRARDAGLLTSVAEQLLAPNDVPHAKIDAPQTDDSAPDDVTAVRKILFTASNKLAVDSGGGYRFHRFWLVHWLMTQNLGAATHPQRIRVLRRGLTERALQPVEIPAPDVIAAAPPWVQILAHVLGPPYFRARHSGRVPGFGRRYRWFLRRQPNLAPGLHRSFVGLAERLTDGQWQNENPEQVRRLMVNAFLEDLREAFRGVGWARRYRTTVPIVLLDGATGSNGGHTLLRTVSAVRNDTGLFDPLLLVSASTDVPTIPDPWPNPGGPGGGGTILERWRARLPQDRRRRALVAWLIAGDLPDGPIPDRPAFDHPARPWLRTRRAATALFGVVVLLLSSSYAAFGVIHNDNTCGDDRFTWLGVEPIASDIERVDDVCVGVSDGSNAQLLRDPAIRDTILEQNRLAVEMHRQYPERPLVTLVYMASFTTPDTAEEAIPTDQREQLAGMAVVQSVQLDKPYQAYEPLVRVLIANAGPQTRHGTRVAQQLGRMAAADPSIVAVVGPSQSRASSAAAIEELAAVGLPTVSAVLSADSLVEVSRLYFQIAPQNRREAAVAAAYANELVTTGQQPTGRPLARRARIYLSDDPGDIYSQNLTQDLRTAFDAYGFPVETVAFTPSGATQGGTTTDRRVDDAGLAGRDACDFDGVVFYAARGTPDFQAFVGGVGDRCRDTPPYILGDDDVTSYVADRDVSTANRSVPFEYLSFARAPELGGDVPVEARDFYARLNALFPYETTNRGRSLDGHAALAYDAAYTAVVAVSYLARDGVLINGGTLWPALLTVTDAANAQRRYRGVTGAIDFGGTVERRVPVDKPLTVVRFADGAPSAAENIGCGARDDPLTRPWCPFDS